MRALPESEGGTEGLTTIERRGRREKEQPKVGPKGEGAGATESKDTEHTELDVKRLALLCFDLITGFISEAGLIGVEGDEAAHGDRALGDEALDIGGGGGGEAVINFLQS